MVSALQEQQQQQQQQQQRPTLIMMTLMLQRLPEALLNGAQKAAPQRPQLFLRYPLQQLLGAGCLLWVKWWRNCYLEQGLSRRVTRLMLRIKLML
jgi:hypothetical protein